MHKGRTRDNVYKLTQGRFQLDIKDNTIQTVRHWVEVAHRGGRISVFGNFHLDKCLKTSSELSADPVLSSRLNDRPHDIFSNM